MARVTGLKLRNGRWTLRVRVPEKLREVLKKREISKSFGDVSASEAARLARIERVAIDEQFEAARILLRQTPVERLSVDDVRHLARVYFHRLEAGAPPVPFDDLERDAMAEANAEDLMAVSQPIWDTSLQQVAMGVALEAKIDLLTASSDFKALCEGIRRAQIEHHVRQIDRLAQSHVQPQDPLFADVSATTPPVSQLTLEKAIQLYKDAPERSGVAEKTRASDKFRFAALMDLLGSSKPVAEITRDACRNARDVLLKLPPHAPKRFPGMALVEVARLATQLGLPTISSKSALLYIECLSALYRWLLQEEHVLRNPAVGLKGPPVPESARRSFTIAELNELFAANTFNGANGRDWQFWLPRVALFTGMRLGEIAGLRASDVVERDGHVFINVAPNEMRKLKTKGSRRLVPVHPALKQLGLIEHAHAQPAGGMLFPELPTGRLGLANAAQKKVGRNIRKVHADANLTFHSFRHTFRDAAREAELPRDIAAAIGGWDIAGKSAMDGYGSGHRPAKLAEWMEKIAYPGLDLNP